MSWFAETKKTLSGIDEREYQIEIAAELLENTEQNTIIQGDVGMGKTETALMEMAARSNQKNSDYSAMIITPNRRLEKQWEDRIDEYELGFDVRTNQTANNGLHRELRNTHNKEAKQRIKQHTKGEGFKQRKRNDITNSDVFITTFQLLSSDIQNNRITDLNMNFDEVFVDEATHMVSNMTMGDAENGKSFVPGYKIDERFHDFADGLAGTRIVGLTALPGRKLGPMQDIFGAEVISPSEEVEKHLPDVYTTAQEYQSQEMLDVKTLQSLDLRQKTINFQDAVRQEYNTTPDSDVAYQFIGDGNDHIEKAAAGLMKARSEAAKISEAVIVPDLTGAELTPKGEYLRELSMDSVQNNEQYIGFAQHISTANNMAQIAEGQVGLVTGQKSKSQNENTIEQYKNGELDGLVMTYGVGGEGLDLGMTDHVLHTSTYISRDSRLSATGRGKRDGGVIEHTPHYDFEPTPTETETELLGREPSFSQESYEVILDVIEKEGNDGELTWKDLQ